MSLWNIQESGSDEECSEESSSSAEEDAEFSANEEDGKINNMNNNTFLFIMHFSF